MTKLLRLSRPRFWVYVLGPYLVGLAAGAPDLDSLHRWQVVLWGLYFLLPANLLIYGVNDIFDWESDKDNAKKIGYETLVPPHQRKSLWRAIAIFNTPFLLMLPFLEGQQFGALCFFWLFSVFYSAPPIRAKTKPFADSIFNVLYVFPGVFSFYLVGGEDLVPSLFLAAWLWAMAMHAYSAAPDIDADHANKMQTIATSLGFRGTLIFCALCYALSALLAFSMGTLALLLGLLYVTLMLKSLRSEQSRIFAHYRAFPLINTAAGFVLFWSIIWARFFA